jgi:hypothetical protein
MVTSEKLAKISDQFGFTTTTDLLLWRGCDLGLGTLARM